MNGAYLLISPCRNEASTVEQTLESVLGQTSPPARWVIVDDGSTDATPDILEGWAADHDTLRIV
ncbi:MAG: glycosyltransferase family A protein, partial [Phycisphaeraceae bacterium]|nr:glycosyltransferase family A protein [Phycisphaeraceae bacterium]